MANNGLTILHYTIVKMPGRGDMGEVSQATDLKFGRDLEESGGTNFLVLELVEGETLADQIKRGFLKKGDIPNFHTTDPTGSVETGNSQCPLFLRRVPAGNK